MSAERHAGLLAATLEPVLPMTLAGTSPAGASPAETAERIQVLVVDDHRAFAGALAIAIDSQADLVSVGSASSIEEALKFARQMAPDVVLLDIHLPDGDGIEAIPRLALACPGARILILTGHTDVDVLARAGSAGVAGFLPKEGSLVSLFDAIRAANTGDMLVEGSTLAAVLGRLSPVAAGASGARRVSVESAALTPRERDVLLLMGQGMDPHAIAAALRISLHTCRGYQKAIMGKLQVHSQLEAVVVATRRGLLPRISPRG